MHQASWTAITSMASAYRSVRAWRSVGTPLVAILYSTVDGLETHARAALLGALERHGHLIRGPYVQRASFEPEPPIVRVLAHFDTYARRHVHAMTDVDNWLDGIVTSLTADEF